MFDGHDDDYALALKLQAELDSEDLNSAAIAALDEPWGGDTGDACVEVAASGGGSKADLDTSTMSLVDPRWELIDPLPDIRALFIEFNDKYFWSKLAGIEIRWSPRMTL